ncbi:unnamed protein product [Caenorhabditis brenneri]
MVHYKLTYFDVRGLGEVSRQLFHLADIPFEDVRIPRNDNTAWSEFKKHTPFGQMPVLTIKDTENDTEIEIPQSSAIGRYLAKKFGYAGKTNEEAAWVDAVIDQFKDFLISQKRLTMAMRNKKSPEQIEELIESEVNPAKRVYFKILNELLEKSQSGYLIGDSLTWADLQIADNLTTLKGLNLYVPSEEPILSKFHEKIMNTPKLKEYFANRPTTLL